MSTKNLSWEPTKAWWIVACCLNRVMKVVDITIASLQGKQLAVAAQRQILDGLKVDLLKLGCGLGPLNAVEISVLPKVDLSFLENEVGLSASEEKIEKLQSFHICRGSFAMKVLHAHNFVENCGSFAMEQVKGLLAGNLVQYVQVMTCVCSLFVDIISGVDSIQAERDASNDSANEAFPATTPSQRQFMSNRDFSILLSKQKQRLSHTWSAVEIDQLEEQFDDMKQLIFGNNNIKTAVTAETNMFSFAQAWAPFDPKNFASLKRFFGGLSSVFPGTATVESDFSLINWEKDDYRSSLTDFSLEGILHCKQFFELNHIDKKMEDGRM